VTSRASHEWPEGAEQQEQDRGSVDGSHDQGAILVAAVVRAKKRTYLTRTGLLTRFVALPY
jgi:hypothetical protein